MKNNNAEFYNPNYKIGIKELTAHQLAEGLPNYNTMHNRIEKIRRESAYVDKVDLEHNPFETLKYDNIFSILGGRGAGKTSILFTLYKQFKCDQSNIMIPIVMPELFDKKENIISWILSAIESCLSEIEEKFDNEKNCFMKSETYNKMCEEYDFFDRCLFNKNNKLRKRFNELKQVFYDNENKSFGSNYSENSELMANSAKSGFEILPKFICFWNTLIAAYERYLVAIKNEKKTPLVFLFIDDADLKPEIINDLLFVIPKFLSHPNVVVFISGSHKTLALAVKNHMFKSITQNSYDLMSLMNIEHKYNGASYRDEDISHIKLSELRYGKEYYRIDKLSDEILRKLFPVYNRFFIKKYESYQLKQEFQIFKNDDEPTCRESISFSDKIAGLLYNFYNNVLEMHRENVNKIRTDGNNEPSDETIKEKIKNFRLLKINNKNEVLLENGFYLSFFGRYARDICAVYYALKEMLLELEDTLKKLYSESFGVADDKIPSKCIENIYSIIRKFLEAAISSNRNLKMFFKYIDDVVKTQLLHWQLYVDYSKVLEIFKKPEYFEANQSNPEPFIEMLCLLNFIEKLIVLIMPQRRKCHGANEMQEFLNSAKINVIQYSDDIDELFKQYYVFNSLNIVPKFDVEKIEHQNNFLNGIDRLDLINKYNDNSLANQEWIMIFSNVYYKRFSAFSRLAEFSDDLLIIKEQDFIDDSYNKMKSKYYAYLREKLTKLNEVRKAPRLILDNKKVKKMIFDPMTENILRLENSIHSIIVYVSEFSYKGDLSETLELLDIYDNRFLKREVYKLMNLLKLKKFARDDMVKQIKKIQFIIEADTDDYISLHLWYDSFIELLNNSMRIRMIDSNESFNDAVEWITNHYERYVDYYVSMIGYKIEKENKNLPIQFHDKNLKKIISPYVERLERQEWRALTGMEW